MSSLPLGKWPYSVFILRISSSSLFESILLNIEFLTAYTLLINLLLGRLFFHYSHFNGNSNDLRLNDEVEFEVIIDRDNRKVATRVMKLKKGTINFESFSPERVNGEVASPPSGNHPGSLSYNSTGEFFFLPFGASDISSACQLYKGWLGSRGLRSCEDAIFITF